MKLFLVVTEESDHDHLGASLGAFFILRKDIGVVGWLGGPENVNFLLLYVVKMSLRRWVGGSKKNTSNHPYLIKRWPLT